MAFITSLCDIWQRSPQGPSERRHASGLAAAGQATVANFFAFWRPGLRTTPNRPGRAAETQTPAHKTCHGVRFTQSPFSGITNATNPCDTAVGKLIHMQLSAMRPSFMSLDFITTRAPTSRPTSYNMPTASRWANHVRKGNQSPLESCHPPTYPSRKEPTPGTIITHNH